MGKDEPPRDFDWVTARHECSPVRFFERLRLGAEQNTETRNRVEAERQSGMKFGHDNHRGVWSVYREGRAGIAVRFRLDGDTIYVEATEALGGPEVNFSGTLTLTNEAKCRLRIGNEELDEWQVLRKALEPLFFPA